MEILVKAVNPLLELCTPIFALTAVFRQGDRGLDLELNYAEKLKGLIEKIEHEAFNQQLPLFEVQQIKYAITAYTDEMVLNSAWPARSEWMGNSLQLHYFGEHLAGEGFFKRLSDLRQAGAKYINILEVYYVCLQLGFEGIYRMQGIERLQALQVDLQSQIEMARGVVDPKLTTNSSVTNAITKKVANKLPFWVIGSVTCVLVFSIYLGYAFAINQQARSTLNTLNKIHQQLIYKNDQQFLPKKTNKINKKELQQIAMGDFQGGESRFSPLNANANSLRAPHQIRGSNAQTLEQELLKNDRDNPE